jgi:hypothetical protein
MHPTLIRSFLSESVADLRSRLVGDDYAGVELALDLDVPELIVAFDHEEFATIPAQASSGLLDAAGRQLVEVQRVPILGAPRHVRRIRLRMNLDRFDLQAPTAELLDETGQPLPAADWPHQWRVGGIIDGHREYNRPFFCRPGLREYHSHPQHEDQPWAKFREMLPLHQIVVDLIGDMRTRFHSAVA